MSEECATLDLPTLFFPECDECQTLRLLRDLFPNTFLLETKKYVSHLQDKHNVILRSVEV
jgi:hypothetical protein